MSRSRIRRAPSFSDVEPGRVTRSVVMIPLMVGVLGLTQHQAHGTSLVSLVFTGAAGALTYSAHGNVDVVAAVSLAVPAVATARFGARCAHALPEWLAARPMRSGGAE